VYDFPRYYVVAPSVPPSGFAIDVVEAVALRAGFEVRYLIVPSGRAGLTALNDGSADVVLSLGILPSRAVGRDFSRPVQTIQIEIFVRSATSDVADLRDLAGRSVAVVQGNVGVEIATPETGVLAVPYASSSSSLSALIAGTVDAMIYPEPMTWNLATELGLQDLIKGVGEPLREVRGGFVVREGNAAVISVPVEHTLALSPV